MRDERGGGEPALDSEPQRRSAGLVCPKCGAPAGEQAFCGSSGMNLAKQRRLLTRGEWEQRRGRGARRWRLAGITGAVLILVAVAFGVVMLVMPAANLTTDTIPSEGMAPTLVVGNRVSIDASGYRSSTPRVGDIVVFHPPQGAVVTPAECGDPRVRAGSALLCDLPTPQEASVNFIKRIVGGPGDTIQVVNGHVIRNGKPEADGYIRPCSPGACVNSPQPITIPPGHWFMMGDNRGESDDSRFWGPVPTSWLVGPVVHCAFLDRFCHRVS
jgi:signal peptidase I